jgi:serralysin
LGDAGADVLTGGLGADAFVYSAVSHSVLATGIDHIADFSKTDDIIDLSAIDAVAGGADDAFVFVGTAAFAGAGPQLRYVRDTLAGTTTIELRLGNSASVDMTIILETALTPAVGDFVL